MAQNYVLLERIELNASAASVTFDNLPDSGYTDLKVVLSARESSSGDYVRLGMDFNSITSGISGKLISGSGSAASSGNITANGTVAYGVTRFSATANSFSNVEIYIPNFLVSGIQKSFSIEAVEENNATAALGGMSAGLSTITNPITTIKLYPDYRTQFAAKSTFSLYGLAAVGTTPVLPVAQGGDVIVNDGTYWYHTFKSSGTFTAAPDLTCDYLVVAGGGGGGGGAYDGNGGGGAGGLRSTVTRTGGNPAGVNLESPLLLTEGTYPITIGGGGPGGYATDGSKSFGTQGGSSTFSTITSIGGGYGASNTIGGGGGGNGGAGGGSFGTSSASTGGAGTANQGYNGGGTTSNGPWGSGGGGGGAGAIGGSGTSGSSSPNAIGGAGGAGVANSITGSSVTYAGGGGASTGYGSQGAGGSGGGGAGTKSSINGNAGTFATGSGGGGNGNQGYPAIGGNGGSGIVIIRYAMV
tara:strand:+ start:830 stop:2236 length:1407 start_codon:yes stop_codon:yes gene_type:complete